MFQEQQKDALRWFCHWGLEVFRCGPGKKIIFIDELWRFVDAHPLPPGLEKIARMGRAEGLELLTATQHPCDYHRDWRAEVTEWVCFNPIEPGDLDAVRPCFRGVDRVVSPPWGSFIAYNRESGGGIRGQALLGRCRVQRCDLDFLHAEHRHARQLRRDEFLRPQPDGSGDVQRVRRRQPVALGQVKGGLSRKA